jgi:hypothetical protein
VTVAPVAPLSSASENGETPALQQYFARLPIFLVERSAEFRAQNAADCFRPAWVLVNASVHPGERARKFKPACFQQASSPWIRNQAIGNHGFPRRACQESGEQFCGWSLSVSDPWSEVVGVTAVAAERVSGGISWCGEDLDKFRGRLRERPQEGATVGAENLPI